MSNKDFINEELAKTIQDMQITMATEVAEKVEEGFVPTEEDSCRLGIISILIHATDNVSLYTDSQWQSIQNLYNNLING